MMRRLGLMVGVVGFVDGEFEAARWIVGKVNCNDAPSSERCEESCNDLCKDVNLMNFESVCLNHLETSCDVAATFFSSRTAVNVGATDDAAVNTSDDDVVVSMGVLPSEFTPAQNSCYSKESDSWIVELPLTGGFDAYFVRVALPMTGCSPFEAIASLIDNNVFNPNNNDDEAAGEGAGVIVKSDGDRINLEADHPGVDDPRDDRGEDASVPKSCPVINMSEENGRRVTAMRMSEKVVVVDLTPLYQSRDLFTENTPQGATIQITFGHGSLDNLRDFACELIGERAVLASIFEHGRFRGMKAEERVQLVEQEPEPEKDAKREKAPKFAKSNLVSALPFGLPLSLFLLAH